MLNQQKSSQMSSASRSGLKSAFSISIKEEERDDTSINQIIEYEEESQILSETEEEKAYNEIPETKGLLPPLPNESQSLKSPKVELYEQPEFHNEHTLSSPISTHTRQKSNTRPSLLNTPIQEYHHKFETPSSIDIRTNLSSATTSTTPNGLGLHTPRRLKEELETDGLDQEMLNYSPAITIEERFEVSLDIPITESNAPKTIEEKIKFYERVQKKELDEFNKTLNSLRKSGWMSEKELIQLESSKVENFNKWEIKIESLRQSNKLRKKSSTHSLNSSSNLSINAATPMVEDYFQSPRRNHSNSNVSADSGNKKLFGDSIRSPTLQSLEQKFSSFGIN